LLKICYVPATSAAHNRLLFLLRPCTVLIKQTKQAVCAIKQSIFLDVNGFNFGIFFAENLRSLQELLFLLRPCRVLIKQTKQAVCAIEQSIFLDVNGFNFGIFFAENLRSLQEQICQISTRFQCYKTDHCHGYWSKTMFCGKPFQRPGAGTMKLFSVVIYLFSQ
jgi:hypothetical protein